MEPVIVVNRNVILRNITPSCSSRCIIILITSSPLQIHPQADPQSIPMLSTPQPLPHLQHSGPIQNLYNLLKNHLPETSVNHLLHGVDHHIVKALGGVDKMINNASSTVQKAKTSIPNPVQIRKYVATTSDKTLVTVENFLEAAIAMLGGKVEENRSQENTTAKLMSILILTRKVSSLLALNAGTQLVHYMNEPSALVRDSRNWANQAYIEVLAITNVLKELFMDTLKQLFGYLGIRYVETKNQVRLLLTNFADPERACQLIKEKLLEAKSVTVKSVEQGVEIMMDREHYSSNLKKLVSSILETTAQLTVKADAAIQKSSSYTRSLYTRVIENYKTQKTLLLKASSTTPQ